MKRISIILTVMLIFLLSSCDSPLFGRRESYAWFTKKIEELKAEESITVDVHIEINNVLLNLNTEGIPDYEYYDYRYKFDGAKVHFVTDNIYYDGTLPLQNIDALVVEIDGEHIGYTNLNLLNIGVVQKLGWFGISPEDTDPDNWEEVDDGYLYSDYFQEIHYHTNPDGEIEKITINYSDIYIIELSFSNIGKTNIVIPDYLLRDYYIEYLEQNGEGIQYVDYFYARTQQFDTYEEKLFAKNEALLLFPQATIMDKIAPLKHLYSSEE